MGVGGWGILHSTLQNPFQIFGLLNCGQGGHLVASVSPGWTRLKGNEAVEFDVEELQTGLSCRDAQNIGQGSGLNGQMFAAAPVLVGRLHVPAKGKQKT